MLVEKINTFIDEMNVEYSTMISEGVWKVNDTVVMICDSILVFRTKITEISNDNCELYKKLLELNLTGLTHGAYAIESTESGHNIVIIDTLQSDNIDFNEFRASIESIELAITEHQEMIKEIL